jgi:hypothetical protein
VFRARPKEFHDMNMQRLLDTSWKLAVILCATVLMVAAFQSPQSPDHPADSIRAQRFVLVDAQGREIGMWGIDRKRGEGQALILYDTSDGQRDGVSLRVESGRAEVMVEGNARAGAVRIATDVGTSSLGLYDCCLEPTCNGIVRSCRAGLEVLQAGARMHLDKTHVEHEPGSHIDTSSAYLRFPDSPKAYSSMDRK